MKSKNTDSVMELKKILDQMIREEFRDAKDRRQVVRVELLVCDEDIEAARSLKPLYMKTSELTRLRSSLMLLYLSTQN